MNAITTQSTHQQIQQQDENIAQSQKALLPPNATSMTVEVYKDGGIVSGYYKVTVNGNQTQIVDGQTMVLMLGAFIANKVENGFLNLFDELQKRNEAIDAIKQLMPIAVKLQTAVPNNGSLDLTGADATIWKKYAPLSGLSPSHHDTRFAQHEIPEILDQLQNSLSAQTRAGEQQMMKLNTQASLRTTVYGLMQSNASAFKQSLHAAATGG